MNVAPLAVQKSDALTALKDGKGNKRMKIDRVQFEAELREAIRLSRRLDWMSSKRVEGILTDLLAVIGKKQRAKTAA